MAGVNLIDRILNRLGLIRASRAARGGAMRARPETNLRRWFDMLEAYYLNNALYDDLQKVARGLDWATDVKALRNPAFRTVEFYAATVWPGRLPDALPVVTDNEAIVEPIHQIWQWSNMSEAKQVIVRRAAWSGCVFLKVEQLDDGRPYIRSLEPQMIHSWETDARGFVTYIRIDTPVAQRIGSGIVTRTLTEIWSKADQQVRIYEHAAGDAGADALGEPIAVYDFAEFGIDFVPVVCGKFRDVGKPYGVCAFFHCLDKIDEANRAVSKLHALVFQQKGFWALRNTATDPTGRPLPPPRITSADGAEVNIADLQHDAMVRLPANTSLESLVPNLQYAGILEVVRDHMREIEADLPELTYYRVTDHQDASGRAVRIKLTGAIGKALEARGQLEDALIRANMMALTIGVNAGVFPETVGRFEDGDLAHTFAERDVITADERERSEDSALFWSAAKAAQSVGVPLSVYLASRGWDEPRIAEITSSPEYLQRQALAATDLLALTGARNG